MPSEDRRGLVSPLQGFFEVQTVLTLLFHQVDRVKLLAWRWPPTGLVVSVFFATRWEKIKPFSLKDSLEEEVETTHLIKLQPFSISPPKVLSKEWEAHGYHSRCIESTVCLGEKHLCC